MHESEGFPRDFRPTNSGAPGAYPPPSNPTQPLPAGAFPTGQYPGTQYPGGQFSPGHHPPGQFPGQAPFAPRRRRRTWMVPLVVLVVLVLLLTGVYAVVTKLGGGGRQPESLVPADALAFAKIDLDPGLGQKVAAYRLAKKLPGQQGKSDDDVRSYLLGKLFDDTDISYPRDIQPWLGNRIGIAVLPANGAGDPQVLGVLQAKDGTKARSFLDARRSTGDDFGYVLRNGYVLLAEEQAVVDTASRDAADSSLQGENQFQQDLQHLHGGKIAAAWVDLPALLRAVEASDPDQFSQLSDVKDFQGRFVAGISASADALELEARVIGAKNVPDGPDVLNRLESLPAGSPVGAALSTSVLTADPDSNHALDQFLDDAADDLESDYGVTPADIRNLLGGTAVFGLAGVPRDDEDPKLAVVDDGIADPARAARTIQAFIDGDKSDDSSYSDDYSSSGGSNPDVQVQQTGSGVVVSTDTGYAQAVGQHTGGRLGDDKLFRRTMADAPKHTLGAAYVAVQPFLDAEDPDDVPAEARAVQAVGVTLGTDGEDLVLHARMVIG